VRVGAAFRWYSEGQRLAWRAFRAGTLGQADLRTRVGAFVRPLTTPTRYPEYEIFFDWLRAALDQDPEREPWLLDVGSPKLFSVLLAQRTRATVMATDIWAPAVHEAAAFRGGLKPDAAERVRAAVVDIRDPFPADLLPPGGLFSGAFSMSVIEHIEPDSGGDRVALGRIADVVRPGGQVVVSVPVDARARSEYLPSSIYGRQSSDPRGVFFQRVYDGPALRALCEAVSDKLVLKACVVCGWPDHLLIKLLPSMPVALGFAGVTFPLIADRFEVSEPSSTVPEIRRTGDAFLKFVGRGAPS
jgi:SAM-dependent methyltransferase